ncbi:13455_t:CDS:2, partial [Funneliformis caledonium]
RLAYQKKNHSSYIIRRSLQMFEKMTNLTLNGVIKKLDLKNFFEVSIDKEQIRVSCNDPKIDQLIDSNTTVKDVLGDSEVGSSYLVKERFNNINPFEIQVVPNHCFLCCQDFKDDNDLFEHVGLDQMHKRREFCVSAEYIKDSREQSVSKFTSSTKEEKLDEEFDIIEKDKFTEINSMSTERTRRPTRLVYIFIDNFNVFIEARYTVGELENYFDHRRNSSYFKNLHIDYGCLLMTVQDERKLGASPVIVSSRPPPNDSLWNSIRKVRYDVTVHDRNFDNIEKKVDNEISVAMMNTIRYYDPSVIVLISGDGDFEPTIRQILKDRWKIETWFWTSSISDDLKSNTIYRPLDNLYKSFTYGYGHDFTRKKYGLKVTDGNMSWGTEEIMGCYMALDIFCWYNRLDRNTLCLYFNDLKQLEKAKHWMKTNHPEVQVLEEDEN